MDLKDIIAISGFGGLYKLESQRNNGVIVKELGQELSKFIPTRTHDFTLLDNITVYDDGDGQALIDVFIEMKKKEAEVPVPDAKANDISLKTYLEKIIPKYDKDKVYVSDMRKLVKWYRTLDALKLVDTEKPVKEEPKPVEEPKKEPAVASEPEPAPKKKPEKKTVAEKKPEEKKPEEKKPVEKKAAEKKPADKKKAEAEKKPAAKKTAKKK